MNNGNLTELIRWFQFDNGISPQDVRQLAELYAEAYAKKCLEIAAEEAESDDPEGYYIPVKKESITNIKLPEHT